MLKNLTKDERVARRARAYENLGVAIPDRMRHLKTWRGVAVPFMVVWKDDRPLFSITDDQLQDAAPRLNLCSVCGTKLFRGRWFVGGPLSAFHPNGSFHDFAMHAECMRYSLQVCPYLALPKYLGSVGPAIIDHHGQQIGRKAIPNEVLNPEWTLRVPERPDLFCAVMTTGPVEISASNGSYEPRRPYAQVEFWRHGTRIPDEEGARIASQMVDAFDKKISRPGQEPPDRA